MKCGMISSLLISLADSISFFHCSVNSKLYLVILNLLEITSSDIEYSFNTAKNSDNFSAILDNIVNITISSDDMVMFVLEKPDPYAASCLYFPIIKKDTAVEDADPVGSGRYQLYKDGEKSKKAICL